MSRGSNLSIASWIASARAALRCVKSSTRAAIGDSCLASLHAWQKEARHDLRDLYANKSVSVSAHLRRPEPEPFLRKARDMASHRGHHLRSRRYGKSAGRTEREAALYRRWRRSDRRYLTHYRASKE